MSVKYDPGGNVLHGDGSDDEGMTWKGIGGNI